MTFVSGFQLGDNFKLWMFAINLQLVKKKNLTQLSVKR